MRNRLSNDLRSAVRAHDVIRVAALRCAMAALDNATAVPETTNDQGPAASSEYVAGTAVGLGATEVERRDVSDTEVRRLLQEQIDERSSAADEYVTLGRHDRADRLRAEGEVLRQYLLGTEQ